MGEKSNGKRVGGNGGRDLAGIPEAVWREERREKMGGQRQRSAMVSESVWEQLGMTK